MVVCTTRRRTTGGFQRSSRRSTPSSVTCVSWHSNNWLLATGSSDFYAGSSLPTSQRARVKRKPGELLMEVDVAKNGARPVVPQLPSLAVRPRSCLHVIDLEGQEVGALSLSLSPLSHCRSRRSISDPLRHPSLVLSATEKGAVDRPGTRVLHCQVFPPAAVRIPRREQARLCRISRQAAAFQARVGWHGKVGPRGRAHGEGLNQKKTSSKFGAAAAMFGGTARRLGARPSQPCEGQDGRQGDDGQGGEVGKFSVSGMDQNPTPTPYERLRERNPTPGRM